jgi:nitrogen regulatory protein P-II 1
MRSIMKMVLAFIQPHRLDEVTRALEHIPHFPGMSVTEARGFGREKVEGAPHTPREALTDFTKKARIEVVVHDEQVESVISALVHGARTGQRGDGKIVVLPVEKAVRVRTGEDGEEAV